MANAIVDPKDPDYCPTCGGECVADCAPVCPDCDSDLEPMPGDERPQAPRVYCVECDREAAGV